MSQHEGGCLLAGRYRTSARRVPHKREVNVDVLSQNTYQVHNIHKRKGIAVSITCPFTLIHIVRLVLSCGCVAAVIYPGIDVVPLGLAPNVYNTPAVCVSSFGPMSSGAYCCSNRVHTIGICLIHRVVQQYP